jgi:hypothetical protein
MDIITVAANHPRPTSSTRTDPMHRSTRPFSSVIMLLASLGMVWLPSCSSSDDIIPPPFSDGAADAGGKGDAATDATSEAGATDAGER